MRTILPILLLLPAAASAQGEPYPDVVPVPEPATTETEKNDSEGAVELETIIVTGEKLGRTLDETAASVSITSGQRMDDYGDDSVFDLMDRVANIVSTVEGGFSIRGVGSAGAEGFGAGQAVIGTYVDGIAVDTVGQSGAMLDTFDVAQVEILRGPQSTHQGRNALAGAIVVNTREPTDYWDLRGRLRGGEYGEAQYALAGGGPLGGGFSFRLIGDHQRSDGYISNTTLDDPDWAAESRSTGRGRLAWRSTDTPGLGVLLTAGLNEQQSNRALTVEADAEQPQARRTATDDVEGDSRTRSKPASLRLDVPLTETLSLTATTGFIDSHQTSVRDLDQTPEDYGTGYFDSRGRTLTQELRLGFSDWHSLSGIVGVYAGRFEEHDLYQPRDALVYASEVTPIPPPLGDLIELRVDNDQLTATDARNVALFSEVDWAATERLTVTAGLRYDREQRDTETLYAVTRADGSLSTGGQIDVLDQVLGLLPGINILPLYDAASQTPGSGGSQRSEATYDALLPKLGLRHALTEDLNLLLIWSQAYRPGGAETVPSTGELNVYDPEYTSTWETGLRLRSFKQRLDTRLNIYHTKWRDQQVSIPTPDGLSTYTQNAASSTLYGAELENELRLTSSLQAYASIGYAHTRFDDYNNNGEDYSGNRFVGAPLWTGSTGAIWRATQGWFASGSFSYAGRGYSNPDNDERSLSDIRRTVDLRLGYQGSRFSIVAYARNLLDADYAVYRYHFEPGLGVPYASSLVQYGEPRIIGVQLDIAL